MKLLEIVGNLSKEFFNSDAAQRIWGTTDTRSSKTVLVLIPSI